MRHNPKGLAYCGLCAEPINPGPRVRIEQAQAGNNEATARRVMSLHVACWKRVERTINKAAETAAERRKAVAS